MTDRPIIFSAPMVRALLAGTKTQTRRVLKPQPTELHSEAWDYKGARWTGVGSYFSTSGPSVLDMLKWRVGDRLWVRETWADVNTDGGPGIGYRADGDFYQPEYDGEDFGAGPSYNYEKHPGNYTMWFSDLLAGSPGHGWRSPMFMPRWASRITLTVTDVRVQRIHEISGADAKAEGANWVNPPCSGVGLTSEDIEEMGYQIGFLDIWYTIHGEKSWSENPWVSALSFTVTTRNIDAPETGEPHVRHDR